MEFIVVEGQATIFIRDHINTSVAASLLVSSYACFAKTLATNETVHIYVNKEVDIPFTIMVQIYAAVRSMKNIHAGVTHLIIHIANDFTVKCCNRLFSMFQPSIQVTLETW